MSYSIEPFLESLKENFTSFSFEFHEENFGSIIPIFFITAEKEEILCKTWRSISEFVATNFQSKLKDEFSIWNIYLFFLTPNEISNELKYLIENDTFSSRKIIIPTQTDKNIIIGEHILNGDLNIDKTEDINKKGFNHNPILWSVLNDKIAKKKLNQEIKDSFNEIVEILKTQK
jgi:hypothetical protein